MNGDLTSLNLESKYNVINLNVISSSQISNRTTLVINHLTTEHNEGSRSVLCRLHAKSDVVSKLISIIEIAKRELHAKNIKVYQYSSLSSETTTRKPKVNIENKDSTMVEADAVEEQEDAFQTMPEKEKIRAVPVLTVYLATKSIKDLKAAVGYVLDRSCCEVVMLIIKSGNRSPDRVNCD